MIAYAGSTLYRLIQAQLIEQYNLNIARCEAELKTLETTP